MRDFKQSQLVIACTAISQPENILPSMFFLAIQLPERWTHSKLIKSCFRDSALSMTNVMFYLNIVFEILLFGLQTDVHHLEENNETLYRTLHEA